MSESIVSVISEGNGTKFIGSIEETIDILMAPLFSGRVYPNFLPFNPTYPCMVYQMIASTKVYSHSGYSGLANPRFQFEVYSKSLQQAKEKIMEIKQTLHATGEPFFCKNEHSSFNNDVKIHVARMDWTLRHKE